MAKIKIHQFLLVIGFIIVSAFVIDEVIIYNINTNPALCGIFYFRSSPMATIQLTANTGGLQPDDGSARLVTWGPLILGHADPEVIAACDKAKISMLFTGIRHFRH